MVDLKKIPLPVFFPDATRAVLKMLDTRDIEETKTPGILVNTYHLYKGLGKIVLKKHGGIREFMGWNGAVISDSGGFQVMSIAKTIGGKITDEGVTFQEGKTKTSLTPESSIDFQMKLKTDMVVVLDDFTDPKANYEEAKETVRRTILWAKRSKEEFQKLTKGKTKKPYILAVVQGGEFLDLREYCAKELAKIGFDGFGYGGWPLKNEGGFNYDVAKVIADSTPEGYFLYGLGIGKPEEIVGCADLGFNIFDCVLPTRDARHERLYVYNAKSTNDIDVHKKNFYSYFVPTKAEFFADTSPVSKACDCLLCTRYSRSYLSHLFKVKDVTAMRLATIHNLRFYSILMEKLQAERVV